MRVIIQVMRALVPCYHLFWEALGREALKQKKGYKQMFEGASFFCKLAAYNVQFCCKIKVHKR